MNTRDMTNTHHDSTPAPWQWRLEARAARKLLASRGRRWLAVERGRVWLTRSQHALEPGEDIWLGPGERIALPPGSEWVAEGWPEARVLVLESAPAA